MRLLPRDIRIEFTEDDLGWLRLCMDVADNFVGRLEVGSLSSDYIQNPEDRKQLRVFIKSLRRLLTEDCE